MSTKAQIEANRENALKSTGPRTDEGKQVVSRNAIKHGLLSNTVLVPGEEEGKYNEVRLRLWEELGPVGIAEEYLVERIAVYMWRLRRIFQIEAHMLAPREMHFDKDRSFEELLARSFINLEGRFTTLSRYEICIERMLSVAFRDLQALKASRQASAG